MFDLLASFFLPAMVLETALFAHPLDLPEGGRERRNEHLFQCLSLFLPSLANPEVIIRREPTAAEAKFGRAASLRCGAGGPS